MDEHSQRYADPFGNEVAEAAKNLETLGARNLAAIFMALVNDTDIFREKDNIKSLIYLRTPLMFFEMPASDYGAFRRDAENYRIVISAVSDKNRPDYINVIIRKTDLSRIKQIFDEASYDTSNIVLEEEAKNQNARAQSGATSAEHGLTSKQAAEVTRMRTNAPSVRSLIRRYRQEIELSNPQPEPEPQSKSWRDLIAGNAVGGG